ncbi:loricrin-related protein [Prunus dulcis]|uniref:Loricrin-related protein n=1 Tax=Prunus dulcis TaxID=3755 RepID=A0A4Y1QW31_PRUDU|nr:loricrin-related protein [Prunus dulcis]
MTVVTSRLFMFFYITNLDVVIRAYQTEPDTVVRTWKCFVLIKFCRNMAKNLTTSPVAAAPLDHGFMG